MTKLRKLLLLFSVIFIFSACNTRPKSSDFEYEALLDSERIDKPVDIAENIKFKAMSGQAKAEVYKSLDEIGTSSKMTKLPEEYSHIQEIDSEHTYLELLESSQEQAVIVYLGFDECPWCKAFSPKLNQLASEFDIPVYYYNTQVRNQDESFTKAMEIYDVDTVPYAFIVDKHEAKERINHHSSMEQIEEFINLYVNEYLN